MVLDIKKFFSHPDKTLFDHIQGVIRNVKKLPNSRFAELVAIFHDLGKLNPNFQNKLDPEKNVTGYANHSYLSAYAFFCAFGLSKKNLESLKEFLMVKNITKNDLIAFTVLIAKHHGNLPDFSPCDYAGTGASILSKRENKAMYQFINREKNLPLNELINCFVAIEDFQHFLRMPKVQESYAENLYFKTDDNLASALDFFLNYQLTFASIIQADKTDAAKLGNFIDQQRNDVKTFSESFKLKLSSYLSNLNQETKLNKLRTEIREHAVKKIKKKLKENKRIYELTAPTGSGKTLMMLSLASEIIEDKGPKRIIYILPFLSITEQVEAEILKIFKDNKFIRRVDSKSENKRFEELQRELDESPSEKKLLEISLIEHQENTFAYPFIITTFVRFFETLLSNRNYDLLKLPNFSSSIFLIDEIQSLPPRLYGFFIAYLSKFCEKVDSYAIISSATQPNYSLPQDYEEAKVFFSDYSAPTQLLPLRFFKDSLFNRYQITFEKEPISLEVLAKQILLENQSVLVVLNTVQDTKDLFNILITHKVKFKELLLLNTHFTPYHRKIKIHFAKWRLKNRKRVILISTQLIEAGVDIDFPIVYRDFATIPSIIQTAGRCNREGKLDSLGQVRLFNLKHREKIRSELIYRGKDKELLRFSKIALTDNNIYQERDLMAIQIEYFKKQ
jgi:CRISPR-associated endonuclease/helicase Cas3